MTEHKQAQEDERDDKMQMGDQGPSYGSSYNESKPGEIEEHRRAALREQEADERQPDRDER
ncbi:MAG TPA: hypothetical protein VFZ66_18860 [Herpetosiphonaceae bacterium]